MKSQVLHAVWCNVSGEAVGEIWKWSLFKLTSAVPQHLSVQAFAGFLFYTKLQSLLSKTGATVMNVESNNPEEVPHELDIALDLEYSGGCHLTIQVDLLFSRSVQLKVTLIYLKGRARLRLSRTPCTHWSLAFYEVRLCTCCWLAPGIAPQAYQGMCKGIWGDGMGVFLPLGREKIQENISESMKIDFCRIAQMTIQGLFYNSCSCSRHSQKTQHLALIRTDKLAKCICCSTLVVHKEIRAVTRGEILSRPSLSHTAMATNADQWKWRQIRISTDQRKWRQIRHGFGVSWVFPTDPQEPEVEFEAESQFEGRNFPQLSSLIVNHLRKSLHKKHTLPNYKLRFHPFFAELLPQDESQQVYVHNSLIAVGNLEVNIIGCSRLPEAESGASLYCSVSVDSLPWKQLAETKRNTWPYVQVFIYEWAVYIVGYSMGSHRIPTLTDCSHQRHDGVPADFISPG